MLNLNSDKISFGRKSKTSAEAARFDSLPAMKYEGKVLRPMEDLYADRVFLYAGSGLEAVVKLRGKDDDDLFALVKGVDCNVVGIRAVGDYVVMNKMDGDLRDLARRMRESGASVDSIYEMAVVATLDVAQAYACLMDSCLYYMDGKTDNSLFRIDADGVEVRVVDLDSLHQLGDPGYVRTFVDPSIPANYTKTYPRPALQTQLDGRRYVAYQAWLVLFDFLRAAGVETWNVPRAREVERFEGTERDYRMRALQYMREMYDARRSDMRLRRAIAYLEPRMQATLDVQIPLISNTKPPRK